jgi:branched-chain amino acid transport system substrate-binding protein
MRPLHRRAVLTGGMCLPALGPGPARAWGHDGGAITIGVLTDMTGPYRFIAGPGSVACAQLAVREAAQAGLPAATVISADHHNDPALGAQIARDWYGKGVDLIVDVPNSAVALAVNDVARAANRAYINCGAGANGLTGAQCCPVTVHWSYDTHMLARSTGGALVAHGGSTWFFVTPDYAFGHELQAETTRQVLQAGGRILGDASYAFPGTVDFRPMLRAAVASNAQVLGLANAGADVSTCVAQARAEGIADETRIACLSMQIADVHRIGLAAAGGLMLTESFYWDLNDRTRAFTKRLTGAGETADYPGMIQAGCYAGVLHFLKALAARGGAAPGKDGAAVVARMKAMPTGDDAFGTCRIRQDGRVMVAALLFEVKSAEESAGAWDYYRLVSSVPAEAAFVPEAQDGCVTGKA